MLVHSKCFSVLSKVLLPSCLLFFMLPLVGASQTEKIVIDGKTLSIGPSNQKNVTKILEKEAKQGLPAKEGILFIGSSTIRLWRSVSKDMTPLPVINRGFGGARSWEVLHFIDDLAIKHKPKLIVYFCGTNDAVNKKNDADFIYSNYLSFVQTIREQLPDTRFIYLSVTKVPSREKVWGKMDAINQRAQADAIKNDYMRYFDMNQFVFDEHDKPITTLYRKDQLHLNREGYAILTKLLRPLVEEEWKRACDETR